MMMKKKITKKALRETQTLRAGCSKAESEIFAPPQTPFPVWRGSMHAISSYRGNRPTHASVSGPDAWNSMPRQLRGIAVAFTFKRHLKSELFFQAYGVSTTASTVAEP